MFSKITLDEHVGRMLKTYLSKTSTIESHGWCLSADSISDSVTYHIHHHEGHWGQGDIQNNHGHFLDPAAHPGCLHVWSLAVWVHIDEHTANTLIRPAHTADLWFICDSEWTICSFFCPYAGILSVEICPPRLKIKEEHQSPIYQSTLNYLKVPRADGWIMSAWRPLSTPADFFLSTSSRPENTH